MIDLSAEWQKLSQHFIKLIACSHRRHGQHKTVLSSPCRRCEIGFSTFCSCCLGSCDVTSLQLDVLSSILNPAITTTNCFSVIIVSNWNGNEL